MRRGSFHTRKTPVYTEVVVPLSGSGTVNLPANYVKALGCRYELIGSSSGSRGGASFNGGGGVGGAAAVWGTDYSPNPGDSVAYSMGVAGNHSNYNVATGLTAGTDSWWNSTSIARAAASAVSSSPGAGAPGLAANSVGDNKLDGSPGTAGNVTGSGHGGVGGAAASTPNIAGGIGGTAGRGTVAGQNGNTAGGGQGTAPGGGPGGGRGLTNGDGADGRPGAGRVAYTVVT